jgi:hypothetical protein
MLKKHVQNFLLLLILLGISSTNGIAQQFKFKPTITLRQNFTKTIDYSVVNSGAFEIEHRKANIGFEITQKVYIDTQLFLRLGIRYHHYKRNIYALNQIKELRNYPHPFYWENRYTGLTIPIQLGKDYYINKVKRGDFYCGVSLGILMTTFAKIGGITPTPSENTFNEWIIGSANSNENLNPNYFYSNVEAGINFIPFKSVQQLSIGFNVVAQLNRTGETKHTYFVEVPSMGYNNYYELFNRNRFINFAACVSYSF